jgi:hypothetical protein
MVFLIVTIGTSTSKPEVALLEAQLRCSFAFVYANFSTGHMPRPWPPGRKLTASYLKHRDAGNKKDLKRSYLEIPEDMRSPD